jgi:hypothetical protein
MNKGMTTTRRILVLAGTVLALMIGTSVSASAAYSDSAARTTSITTATVRAPGNVVVNDYCMTTTTTVRQTIYRDPTTGASWQTAYSSTSSSALSTSNVQSYTSTPVAGPGLNETTTTTVTENTDLYVTVTWAASTSARVTGYVVNAHLGIDGSVFPMVTTAGTTTSAVQDADALAYQPRLSVTTQTAYGWTAASPLSALIAC